MLVLALPSAPLTGRHTHKRAACCGVSPTPWMQPASDALVMMHIMWAHILAVLRACVHAGTGRKRTEGPQLRFVSRVQRRAAVIDRPGPSLGCPVTKTTLDLQTKISSANDDASTMLVVTPKGVVLNIVRGTKVCSASISGSLQLRALGRCFLLASTVVPKRIRLLRQAPHGRSRVVVLPEVGRCRSNRGTRPL